MTRAEKVQVLKNRLMHHKLIQGPLAGVSHHVFREGVWSYSEPAWVCSEMVSCHTIAHGSEALKYRFLNITDHEGPMCLQIAAACAKDVEEAFSVINQLNVSMVDLNAGCPVKKIRKKHMGSALLEEPDRLYEVLTVMKSCSKVPVSVKVRLQDEQDKNDQVINVVGAAGVDFLTVHGRTYQDSYDVEVDYDRIGYFARSLDIPVIGNGDVSDVKTTQDMMQVGVSGAMVGRYGVGQPWLIADIQRELGWFNTAKRLDRNPLMLFGEHVQQMAELPGGEKFAMLSGYGLIKYYVKRNQLPLDIVRQVRSCQSLQDLLIYLKEVSCDLFGC
jgi:tRNA-dihydrouridine synthase B